MTAARWIALVLLLGGAAGCATYQRGELAAASVMEIPLEMTVLREQVEGRACGDWLKPRYTLALDDALRQAPDANALVNVTYHFEAFCMVVRGTAVRVH